MKKSTADLICKLWNEKFAGNTPATMTRAVVCDNGSRYAVEVRPFGEYNNGNAFYTHEEVTDIERAFKVSAYITQDEEHKLYARIY